MACTRFRSTSPGIHRSTDALPYPERFLPATRHRRRPQLRRRAGLRHAVEPAARRIDLSCGVGGTRTAISSGNAPGRNSELLDRKIGPYPIWKMTLTGDVARCLARCLRDQVGCAAELIGERLAVMPNVARHKYNSGARGRRSDPRSQVIEAVTAQAVEAGLDKEVAAKFFQAQIDASKMIQSERIAAWKAEGHAHFTDVPDLEHGDPAQAGRADPGVAGRAQGRVAGTEASGMPGRALRLTRRPWWRR